MEKIYEIAFALHELLIKSEQYLTLKEKEKEMLSDCFCVDIINKYHNCEEKYQQNKSASNLKDLHEVKLIMDETDLIIQYKKAYKEYQILIGEITDLVFKDFSSPSLIDKIIRAK